MTSLYLGGAFAQYNPQEVTTRQAEVEALLHPSITVHKPKHQGSYPKNLTNVEATLTQRDMLMVRAADLLILDCLGADKISRGSVLEMGWASAMGKPFILIAEEGNPHIFNMSQSLTRFIVPSRKHAADIANSLLT
ncbi:MAG: hypothetical protein GC129_05730 [Proteobacteria bacterium]|nr:hypothetical protein [Pseudomonadota bacterium]